MSHSDALDKRLRAVYDAFDQRNHKGAIKLCNAGIQKYPDCYAFKSLKAVALSRSGKQEDALQVADEVLAAAPPDDHVLNMLLLVLKPANRAQDVTAAYEAACSKQPNNEELLQGLFGCHVRSFSYAAQQHVAMKLNKLHPNELYQWWVVASLALQAHAAAVQSQLSCSNTAATAPNNSSSHSSKDSQAAPAAAAGPAAGTGLGADKLLALAEAMAGRLLKKVPAQGEHHSWEAVVLYLGLLQAQGKYDDALAAVRGPLGSAFSLSAERHEAEAALLLAKGDLQAAAELYQQALQEQPDDWAVLLLYLDCLLPTTASTLPACCSTAVSQMVTGVEASTRPGCQIGGLSALLAATNIGGDGQAHVQDRVAQAEAFIRGLTADVSGKGAVQQQGLGGSSPAPAAVLRGPSLALVELAKRKLQLSLADEQQLVDALLQYHDRFGHVVSCAMDVFCYLELLGSASRLALSAALADRAQQAAQELKLLQAQAGQQQQQQDGNKQLLKLLRRQMSARQIQADIGAPAFTVAGAAAAHAQQLLQLYTAALPLYNGLDERERGPADELLWQAAAALVAAASLQPIASESSSSSSSSSSVIKYLLQAVLVLEAAAKGRPYCAPVRLGLTGLYGLLGNAAGAAHHFAIMDVKHVQHDTLSSHHLLPLLLGLKANQQAGALLAPTCALFEDHLVDAGDTLMQAYKNGTHTKVLEFVCFTERLERSHTFVLARAERSILSISSAADTASATSAVAAAVQALPLDLLDSINWRGMRFNDDLTTRLPWLPPIHGPRHLTIVLWWEQQQQQLQRQVATAAGGGSSPGSTAACWWRQVAAAEADIPAAAALRDSMKAAAQQRWLLPHLLHAALEATSNSNSSSSSAQGFEQLPKLLQQLAAALGHGSAAELNVELDAAFGQHCKVESGGGSSSSSSSATLLSRQLQLLDAAVFSLVGGLQALLHPQSPGQAHGAVNGCAAAEAPSVSLYATWVSSGLQGLQQVMTAQLQPDSAYQGCVLPGYALSAAALLLSESCSWLVLCLEAWCKVLKQPKKKKGSKAQGSMPAASDQTAQESAVQALVQVHQSVLGLVQGAQECAAHLLQGSSDSVAADLLSAFDESSDAVMKVLVGWESRVSVQLVLLDLVKQQRSVLTQLRDVGSKLHNRLRSLSW